MDVSITGGSCDPYVLAEFGNYKIATKPKLNTRNPLFF
jgi:hypothetical protein